MKNKLTLVVLVLAFCLPINGQRTAPFAPLIETRIYYSNDEWETLQYPDCVEVGDQIFLPNRSMQTFTVLRVRHEIYALGQQNEIRRRLIFVDGIPQ